MLPLTQNKALCIAYNGQPTAHTVIRTVQYSHWILGECNLKSKCNELFQQSYTADFTSVNISEVKGHIMQQCSNKQSNGKHTGLLSTM